jgi:CO/xanthine dehydrogenase FAD-binding subunit
MEQLEYYRPKTLEDTLTFLEASGEETQILAGGTDVMVDMREGKIKKKYLLDVSRLSELKGIFLCDEGLCVGAGVTISEIHSSEVLTRYAPALQKCARKFASQQIRNVATIGGNVAHCSPCGDTIPPLVIHGAKAVLLSRKGRRDVPVEAIASGPYACSLPANELIVRFVLEPEPDLTFADFIKIGRRKALAIARISLAAMARQAEDGRIEYLRVSLGSCTPTPWRVKEVEDFLIGRKLTGQLLWEAGKILAQKTIEITGRRPSAVYKEPVVQGLLVKMLLPLVRK